MSGSWGPERGFWLSGAMGLRPLFDGSCFGGHGGKQKGIFLSGAWQEEGS